MKAIILAAGRGERLRPLTDTVPKPLIKVGGQCLIEYHLFKLAKVGVDTVVINTAHLSEQFEPTLGNGSRYGLAIQYSYEPVGGLETGGGIVNALKWLGDKSFIVLNGDIWTDYPFAKLLAHRNDAAHIVLVDNPEHNPEGDYSIQKGMLSDKQPKLTYSGMGIFNPTFFNGCIVEKFSLTYLLSAAAEKNNHEGQGVTAEHYQGTWIDVGTVERLHHLEAHLRS